MGKIIASNSALIPITVTEFGQFGSLFERFLFGKEAMKIPKFKESQNNAKAAAELARSTKVPHSVLPRANKIWWKEHREEFYGHSYKAMNPTTYAIQRENQIWFTPVGRRKLS